MIEKFGVQGVQVEEIIDMDLLKNESEVLGLIFLFKYQARDPASPQFVSFDQDIFFANQVINNAW